MPQITGYFETLYFSSFKTDFGWIRPVSNGHSLIRLDWNQTGWDDSDRPDNVSRETKSQLEAFFAGHLHQFDLPLAPGGKSAAGKHLQRAGCLWLISVLCSFRVTARVFALLFGKSRRGVRF